MISQINKKIQRNPLKGRKKSPRKKGEVRGYFTRTGLDCQGVSLPVFSQKTGLIFYMAFLGFIFPISGKYDILTPYFC